MERHSNPLHTVPQAVADRLPGMTSNEMVNSVRP